MLIQLIGTKKLHADKRKWPEIKRTKMLKELLLCAVLAAGLSSANGEPVKASNKTISSEALVNSLNRTNHSVNTTNHSVNTTNHSLNSEDNYKNNENYDSLKNKLILEREVPIENFETHAVGAFDAVLRQSQLHYDGYIPEQGYNKYPHDTHSYHDNEFGNNTKCQCKPVELAGPHGRPVCSCISHVETLGRCEVVPACGCISKRLYNGQCACDLLTCDNICSIPYLKYNSNHEVYNHNKNEEYEKVKEENNKEYSHSSLEPLELKCNCETTVIREESYESSVFCKCRPFVEGANFWGLTPPCGCKVNNLTLPDGSLSCQCEPFSCSDVTSKSKEDSKYSKQTSDENTYPYRRHYEDATKPSGRQVNSQSEEYGLASIYDTLEKSSNPYGGHAYRYESNKNYRAREKRLKPRPLYVVYKSNKLKKVNKIKHTYQAIAHLSEALASFASYGKKLSGVVSQMPRGHRGSRRKPQQRTKYILGRGGSSSSSSSESDSTGSESRESRVQHVIYNRNWAKRYMKHNRYMHNHAKYQRKRKYDK